MSSLDTHAIPADSRRSGHQRRAQPTTPIGRLAFGGVVIASLGGPLALAALYAPTTLAEAGSAAGPVEFGAVVVFAAPLLVWLGCSRQVTGPAGLTGFVQVAAGRRVALVQAALWIFSYLLYLLYTTATVVYDILPVVLPGIRPLRPLLEVAIPVVLAVVLLAGRAVTVAIIGAMAAVQLLLVAALAVVTIAHSGAPALYVAGPTGPTGPVLAAAAQTGLLYVCGSLPVFLGGEVVQATRTVRRGLAGGFLLVAAGVAAVVSPVAANPAFARAEIPGMSMARVFAGRPLALAVGLGVAASIATLMLVEFLALSRLLHAVSGRPVGLVNRILAAMLVAAGPVNLINPDGFYTALLKPSLVALWLSLLMVFAVYPRFAVRHGRGRVSSVGLATAACAFAVYGLYAAVTHAGT